MSVVVVAVPSSEVLAGPDAWLPHVPAGDPPVVVTGGGLAAIVDPARGLRAIFRGTHRLAAVGSGLGEIDLASADSSSNAGPPSSAWVRAGRGSWTRVLPMDHGVEIREVGLLADGPSAVILQWTVSGAAAPAAGYPTWERFRVGGIHIGLDPDAARTIAILPSGSDVERARDLLVLLRARERQRSRRHFSDAGGGLDVRLDGTPAWRLRVALAALDDAPLGPDLRARDGGDLVPFADGLARGLGSSTEPEPSPRWMERRGVVDVAIAALRAGRQPLARSIMDRILADPDAPERSRTKLRTAWAAWSGDLRALGPLSAEDARALTTPTPSTTPRPGPGGSGAPVSITGRGGPTSAATAVVRDWVVERLGVVPEATVGRLRLAPHLPRTDGAIEVVGLRAGDASVTMRAERTTSEVSVRIEQVEGRVPLDLVFEPLLHDFRVEHVLIGDRPADVQRVPEGDGTRLRCKFPLDPERVVRVVGRAGAPA